MLIKKSDEILKIEEALKKAKQKQKETIKKINSSIGEDILNKLNEDDNLKKEFKELLKRYDLKNTINIIKDNYNLFENKNIIEDNIQQKEKENNEL